MASIAGDRAIYDHPPWTGDAPSVFLEESALLMAVDTVGPRILRQPELIRSLGHDCLSLGDAYLLVLGTLLGHGEKDSCVVEIDESLTSMLSIP